MRQRTAKRLALLGLQAFPLFDFKFRAELASIPPQRQRMLQANRLGKMFTTRRLSKREQKRVWNRLTPHQRGQRTRTMRMALRELRPERHKPGRHMEYLNTN